MDLYFSTKKKSTSSPFAFFIAQHFVNYPAIGKTGARPLIYYMPQIGLVRVLAKDFPVRIKHVASDNAHSLKDVTKSTPGTDELALTEEPFPLASSWNEESPG